MITLEELIQVAASQSKNGAVQITAGTNDVTVHYIADNGSVKSCKGQTVRDAIRATLKDMG